MHMFVFPEMLNAKVIASLAASSFLITTATNQTFTAGREARSLFLPFFDFFMHFATFSAVGRWLKIEDGTYIHELSIYSVISDEGRGGGSIQLTLILQDNERAWHIKFNLVSIVPGWLSCCLLGLFHRSHNSVLSDFSKRQAAISQNLKQPLNSLFKFPPQEFSRPSWRG